MRMVRRLLCELIGWLLEGNDGYPGLVIIVNTLLLLAFIACAVHFCSRG